MVEVSSETPATLTLNNVATGQYMLVAKVTEVFGEYNWLDLSATVNENTTYLSENEYLDAFVCTVTVDSRSIIVLNNTYSGATLTVKVWLQPLAIGQFNDYFLNDIQISSTTSREIALEGISGTYTVVVETYEPMNPSAVIMVNGTALTKNPDMYDAWTCTFNLTGESSLVISTTNPEAISVNLTLREHVTVDEELPTDGYAETFAIYEPRYFYYYVEDDGYYSINSYAYVENASFAIEVKTDPNSYKGIVVQGDEFPLYMEAYTDYYFIINYMGIPWEEGEEAPTTVDAWFDIHEWAVPTLEVNYIYTYVPVTSYGESIVRIPMSFEPGTYHLDFDSIPFDVLLGGYTITAHFGNQEVELNHDYAQIEITNETFIWFTTDYSEGFSAGVTINAVEIINAMRIGEWTEISIPANESRIYYIENLEEGYFNIILNNYSGANIVVESSSSIDPIISDGQAFGTFVVLTYGNETTNAILYFYNSSDYTADFMAIVEPAYDVVIELGVVKDIELASGETKVYYLENLAEGLYSIALVNAAGIEVNANGMPVTDGRFVTNFGGESIALRFTNTGANTAVFEVTVTMIANGIITLGEDIYTSMSIDNNIKTFIVEGLEVGKSYTITLSNYATDITVMEGNTTIIAEGSTTATFTATSSNVMLTFLFGGEDFECFSVLVSDEYVPPVDDTILLSVVESIKLSSNSSKTYYIYNLAAGDYRISLSSDLIRVVIGSQTIINYGATKGTFTVTTYSRVALVFYYNGSGTINFNALVTKLDPDLIEIGVAKNITLTADNSAHIYYIEGVTKGLYRVDLTGNVKQIQVIVGSQVVVFYGDNKGYFEYLSKTPADLTVIVSYNGKSTLSFNLTVTKEDDNLLPLGVKRTIEMSQAENVKQYYLEDLSKGQYKITLTLSNGIQIEVLTLNGIIISYGGTEGYFDVQTSVDRLNLIFAYNGSSEVTFTVLVTAVN